MYSVDMYGRVRRACHVDGMPVREAARVFGLHRETVSKMLRFSVVPPINSVRRRNPWIPDQCQSMRTKRTRTHSSYRLTLVGNPRISAADRIYGRHRWDSNLRYVLAHRFDF